eukprot:TRINITY_DN43468_c0_g1_i1.p1 TRINITY_DN43468_c0_g1~~TRINITY_DN43468_c0_g1_i1.p1  ORF type:complete len:175 (+),score=38.19 TRINITY_DN43468_c0_g1_i1:63-587(+)
MEAEQTNEQIPFKIVPLDGDGAEEALEMILNGEAGAVQDWVEEGGDPNAWIQGSHLLHAAASTGNKITLGVLLQAGADVNAIDVQQATALHEAAHACSLECVQLLLTHKADPNLADCDGMTPILYSVGNDNSLEIVATLAKSGAAIDLKNKAGQGLLDLAKDPRIKAAFQQALQ